MVECCDPFERAILTQWKSLVGESVCCVVGFSGGADSTALLWVLSKFRSLFPSFALVAYHVNHGLRETASRDEAFCEEFCQKLAIPLVVDHVNVHEVAEKHGYSLEEAGRVVRREGYERVRQKYGLGWIALAHHRDDQVEGFLLRLMRGGGIEALSVMKPRDGIYLRPLLGFSHAEIVAYLIRQGIRWCEDESNDDIRFDRNWIRHELIPLLETRFKAMREKIDQFTYFLAEIKKAMVYYETPLLKQVEYFSGGWRIPRVALKQWGEFWVRDVVRRLWLTEGIAFVRGSWLGSIRDYGDNETRQLVKTVEGMLFFDSTWLTWVRLDRISWPEVVEIEEGKEEKSGPWLIAWRKWKEKPQNFPKATQWWLFLPPEISRIRVRPIKAGDKILLSHGHKKVQDIWVDEHLPWLERRLSFVVETMEKRTIAVYLPSKGFRVSREFYFSEESDRPIHGIEVSCE